MLLEGNLQGLQHLGFPVTNLERSSRFYTALGFSEAMRVDIPDQNETVKVAMLRKENLTLELYQLTVEQFKEVASRKDGHVDHFALNVLDIDKAYVEIKNAGLEILEENAPVFLPFWQHGVKFFTVRGPDGEKIEFNQMLG
jgi:catechol 2,3-dioxygenase-like lactoylglutathione lyase family enzyme